MVEYALDPNNNSPPPILRLAWNVRNWSALPNAGGVRDQKIGELERMTAALRVFDVVSSYKKAKSKADWIENNPDDWEIYCDYVDIKSGRPKD